MKKIFIFLLLFFLFVPTAFAKEKPKAVAYMTMDFSLENIPKTVSFQLAENLNIDEETVIPASSTVFVEVINVQRALRWHKSGFILCKLNSYISPLSDEKIDVSKKEIYFLARKYEKVYVKEAMLLGTEITMAQAASFFAPGSDILYYFAKGAIKKTTHPHWFKAGISYAYENSICWFWLKGKPIELDIDDEIEIKEIKSEKVDKLNKKVEKRHIKEEKKLAEKELKRQKKELKKQEKRQKKELKEQRLLGV